MPIPGQLATPTDTCEPGVLWHWVEADPEELLIKFGQTCGSLPLRGDATQVVDSLSKMASSRERRGGECVAREYELEPEFWLIPLAASQGDHHAC
jgi:hypothetical protein